MPSLGSALIGAAGSIAGGLIGSHGAKKAAKRQARAAREQLELQRQIYNSNVGLSEPWRATGQGALNNLAQLYGLPYTDYQPFQPVGAGGASQFGGQGPRGGAMDIADMLRSGATPEQIAQYHAGGAPNMSIFQASPDYQFRRQEGMRGLEQSAAARGGAFSGNAIRALDERNSNLASQEFGNYFSRMAQLAGFGSGAAANQQNAGQNYATGAGNALGAYGDARASGILGSSNSWANAVGGLGGAFSDWWSNRRPSAPNTSGGGYYGGYS